MAQSIYSLLFSPTELSLLCGLAIGRLRELLRSAEVAYGVNTEEAQVLRTQIKGILAIQQWVAGQPDKKEVSLSCLPEALRGFLPLLLVPNYLFDPQTFFLIKSLEQFGNQEQRARILSQVREHGMTEEAKGYVTLALLAK